MARKIALSPRFAFCPTIPNHAAQWALAHFVEELYWKSHFSALSLDGRRFDADAFRALDTSFTPDLLGSLLDAGEDIVDAVLARALEHVGADATALERCQHIETTLNARLTLACALAGPAACAKMVAPILPAGRAPRTLHLVRLEPPLKTGANDKQFGQPDLLLFGDRALVMIEMKVRGGTAKALYDPRQLKKYLNIAAYAREHLGTDRVTHVILAPAGQHEIFWRRGSWILDVCPSTGTVAFDTKSLRQTASMLTQPEWRSYLGNPDVVRKMIADLEIVPVCRRSYQDLAATPCGDGSLERAAMAQLRRLADAAERRPH